MPRLSNCFWRSCKRVAIKKTRLIDVQSLGNTFLPAKNDKAKRRAAPPEKGSSFFCDRWDAKVVLSCIIYWVVSNFTAGMSAISLVLLPLDSECYVLWSHTVASSQCKMTTAEGSTLQYYRSFSVTSLKSKHYHKAISSALYFLLWAKRLKVKSTPCQIKFHVYLLFLRNQNDQNLTTFYLSNANNTSCWTRIVPFWMMFCSCQWTS